MLGNKADYPARINGYGSRQWKTTFIGMTGSNTCFGRRVFIETYGCRYNFGDTAKLVEVLKHHGSTLVQY